MFHVLQPRTSLQRILTFSWSGRMTDIGSDSVMRLDEVAAKFVDGDGHAAFLLACLDFAYYVQLMNRQSPLEDCQIMWQHSRDLARFSHEKKNCAKGGQLLKLMDDMLVSQNQEAFMECFRFVIVSLKADVNFSDIAGFAISDEKLNAAYAFESREGIENANYQLLRALLKNGGKSLSRKKIGKVGILKFLALVSFLLLIGYVVVRS